MLMCIIYEIYVVSQNQYVGKVIYTDYLAYLRFDGKHNNSYIGCCTYSYRLVMIEPMVVLAFYNFAVEQIFQDLPATHAHQTFQKGLHPMRISLMRYLRSIIINRRKISLQARTKRCILLKFYGN